MILNALTKTTLVTLVHKETEWNENKTCYSYTK